MFERRDSSNGTPTPSSRTGTEDAESRHGSSRPAASRRQATHTVSARLEQVRSRVKSPTLRDFWRELTESGEYKISYEAVRNYHADRDPPIDYLVRVSDVFQVSLPWLATGRGHAWPTDPEIGRRAEGAISEEPAAEFEPAIAEVFWHYASLTPLARAVALETCDRLHRDAEFRARLNGRTAPTRGYVGRFVGKAMAGPLKNAVAGSVRTSELHPWQVESFVLGICQALSALIPNPNWSDQQPRRDLH